MGINSKVDEFKHGDMKREIARAVFGGKKMYRKGKVSEQWYRKNRTTLNSKLRQAIIDVMPFTVDKKQADVILWTIFDTIVEGVIRDGFAKVDKFGTFYPRFRSARRRHFSGDKVIPAHYELGFKKTKRLHRQMDLEEDPV